MATFFLNNCPHGETTLGLKINTVSHFAYICREGKYAHMQNREEDLVYKESDNLPKWARGEAKTYWAKAEEGRRVNGRAYREIKLGLQEELSLDDNIELVHKFMEEFGISQNHTYTLAIHDKTATFDISHRNIHCHLMFDEREIEPNRDLDSWEYFRRHSYDRNGNVTGGLLKTRYYSTAKCTQDMRKKWEEIVNEKLEERGIAKRVSCKTLSAQREDLLAQGLTEEAEYFNRPSCPHLGNVYRSAENMKRIGALTKQLELDIGYESESTPAYKNDDEEEDNEERERAEKEEKERLQKAAEKAVEDQKIIDFVTDCVLRKIARKIQRERMAQHLEEERENEESAKVYAGEEYASYKPAVVTTADIVDRMKTEEQKQLGEIDEKLKQYNSFSAKNISDEEIGLRAKDRLFNNEYSVLKNEYASCVERFNKLHEENLAHPEERYTYEGRQKQLARNHEKNIYREQKMKIEDKIAAMDAALKGERADEYKAMRETIKNEHEQQLLQHKKMYSEIAMKQKSCDMLHAKILAMEEYLPKDTVLFSEMLPKQLYGSMKINGEVPIRTLPTTVFDGKVFALIDVPHNVFYMNGTKAEFKAVMLGDDVKQGKTDVYNVNVTVQRYKDFRGKVRVSYAAAKVAFTGRKVQLYKELERTWRKGENAGKTSDGTARLPRTPSDGGQPNLSSASRGSVSVAQAIEKLADQAVSLPTKKLIPMWMERGLNDEKKPIKNEMDRVEKELDEGWVKTMHFGRQM